MGKFLLGNMQICVILQQQHKNKRYQLYEKRATIRFRDCHYSEQL